MDLNKILDASNQEEIFVVDYSISIDDYVAIDLSKQNEDLKLFDVSSSKEVINGFEKWHSKNNGRCGNYNYCN